MDKSIQFWWSAPAQEITGYALTCTDISFSRIYGPTSFTAIVKDLSNNTPYTFRLAARNAIGYGPTATFRTVRPGFPLPPPQSIAAVRTNTSSAVVTWTPPTTNLTILGYVVAALPINGSQPTILRSAHNYDTSRLMDLGQYAETSWMTVYTVSDPGYSVKPALSRPITPGFIPSDISGITLWLDAADLSTMTVSKTGDPIVQWRDRVNPNRYVSNTGTRPTFSFSATNTSYPGVVTTGITGFATTSLQLTSTNTMTMFCVSQTAPVDLSSTIMGAGIIQNASATIGLSMDISGYSTTYRVKNDTSGNAVFTSPNFLNTPVLSVSYMDLSSCRARIVAPAFFQDISSARLGNINLNTASTYSLAAPTPHMNISEIIVYGIPLTVEQITSVSTYLYTKWGFSPVKPNNLKITAKYGTAFSISWIGGGSSFSFITPQKIGILPDPWPYPIVYDSVKQTAYTWNIVGSSPEEFGVVAETPFGATAPSDYITYNPSDPVVIPPSRPFDIVAYASSTSIALYCFGGDGATSFIVYDDSENIVNNVVYSVISETGQKIIIVSELLASTQYTFYIEAVNDYGSSGLSAPVTGSTDST